MRDELTGVADFLAVEDVAPDRGAVRDEEGEGVERCDVEVAVDELPCCWFQSETGLLQAML